MGWSGRLSKRPWRPAVENGSPSTKGPPRAPRSTAGQRRRNVDADMSRRREATPMRTEFYLPRAVVIIALALESWLLVAAAVQSAIFVLSLS